MQYYDSNKDGSGECRLKIILQYLVDEDKGQQHKKPDEWMLVPCTTSVSMQENTSVISQDCSLLFKQDNVPTFQALAILNLGNDTVVSIVNKDSEVHADFIETAPSRLNGNQEIETVGRDVP